MGVGPCMHACMRALYHILYIHVLQPSTSQTVSSVFHLRNAKAERIKLSDQGIDRGDSYTFIYIGVTLVRSLTYHHHSKKTAAKINAQTACWADSLSLCASICGTSAQTLRTRSRWCPSTCVLRSNSEASRQTQLSVRSVVASVASPHRRKDGTARLLKNICHLAYHYDEIVR